MSLSRMLNLRSRINMSREDSISLLLSSIGMEEVALAHILNAEGEKIQYVLGTLEGSEMKDISTNELLQINRSVEKTIRDVIKTEMLLQFKLQDLLELINEY